MAKKIINSSLPIEKRDTYEVNDILSQLGISYTVADVQPPYWSRMRDKWLRELVYKSNGLAGVMAQITNKFCAIPPRIIPDDYEDEQLVEICEYAQKLLTASWQEEAERFLFDVLSQDNGGFFEVVGGHRSENAEKILMPTQIPNTNIFVPATGLRQLDAQRCRRTSNEEYPVAYTSEVDGKEYLLHRTRVLFVSDMPSPDPKLRGVGFCAVSRVADTAQLLHDIDIMLMEAFGSRPSTSVIISNARGLAEAMQEAKAQLDANHYTRYGQDIMVEVGQGISEDGLILQKLDLKMFPPDFNRNDFVEIAMHMLALGFGVDTREFWPVTAATRADAEIQNEKSKTKLIAWWLDTMEYQLTKFFAPEGATVVFDLQDDSQDFGAAEIRKQWMDYWKMALEAGTLTIDVVRQQMVEKGFITEAQYDILIGEPEMVEPELPNNMYNVSAKQYRKAIEDDYQFEMDRLLEQANAGEISQEDFEQELAALTLAFTETAFREGMGVGDGVPFTSEEQAALDEQRSMMIEAIAGLALAIFAGEYADNLEGLLTRGLLWANAIAATFQIGRAYDRNNPFLQWQFTAGKQHCEDCARLNGQIHRASEWQRSGWIPRGGNLKCTGRRCGCSFVESSGPAVGGF